MEKKMVGWERARAKGQDLNVAQRLAERSPVLNVANIISCLGVVSTGLAASQIYRGDVKKAVLPLAVGVAADKLDGYVARKLGVDDPRIGAKVDQLADFAKTVMIAPAAVQQDILPSSAAAMAFGPKIMTPVLAAATGAKPKESSKVGKVAEAFRAVTIPTFMGAEMAEEAGHKKTAAYARAAGWLIAATAGGLGVAASRGYLRKE